MERTERTAFSREGHGTAQIISAAGAVTAIVGVRVSGLLLPLQGNLRLRCP